ncbi:MAG: glycosyltransferase [Nostocaceae cyanobacterium]|nr:glycosyltransferase [Nostocaceae cyanobacterium]
MKQASVSVILPAYNAEKTIISTIESIQKQTFHDWEIILINDGSTDNTLELINTIKDERIKIFSYENAGISLARNRGIDQAKGDYIAFIDADDLWTPDKLEAQIKALQKSPEAGLAYSWTSIMNENGEVFYSGTPISYEGDVYANLLLWNFLICGSNPLIRRKAIEQAGEFEPTLCCGEDWDYWLRIASRWHFALVPKVQVLYRKSSGSLTSKMGVTQEYSLMVIDRAFQSAPPHLQHLKRQAQSGIYEYLAHMAWTYAPVEEKPKIIAQKLLKAIKLYPKILKYKNTQVLLIKLLFMKIMSPNIALSIFQKISNRRANSLLANTE